MNSSVHWDGLPGVRFMDSFLNGYFMGSLKMVSNALLRNVHSVLVQFCTCADLIFRIKKLLLF